ncbi:hypothetical protein [Amycolatopsis kentuckyensis]|uniref:hypothetical protein n=1 Tax=Amycolatopsis kentuckyensis TaxID=218823 RepID=UPI00356A9E83
MAFPNGSTVTSGLVNRYMGSAGPSGNDSFTTATKVLIDDAVTFVADPNHIYVATWNTQMSASASAVLATVSMRWEKGEGPVLPTSNAFLTRVANLGANNDSYHFERCFSNLSGLVTIGITAFTNTGTATVYGGANGRELLVKDLGL